MDSVVHLRLINPITYVFKDIERHHRSDKGKRTGHGLAVDQTEKSSLRPSRRDNEPGIPTETMLLFQPKLNSLKLMLLAFGITRA